MTTPEHRSTRGFTLVELMIVLTIAGILMVVGAPALSDFVADQRVRTVTSDIAAEIAFARVKAIEQSRRVFMERTGADWKDGWRIYADLNNDGNYDAGEELKVFDGFPAGNLVVCSVVAGAASNVASYSFRPDGRVAQGAGAGATDGIYVIDTMHNKIRGLRFGTSGRATVSKLNGTTPPCP